MNCPANYDVRHIYNKYKEANEKKKKNVQEVKLAVRIFGIYFIKQMCILDVPLALL
jgi:hypothetical protein